ELVEHVSGNCTDRVLVLGDPLRCEAALKERLDAIVLRRVHADEHRLLQLERQDSVLEARETTDFRREELAVAAGREDAAGSRHRPEAVFLGKFGEGACPMDRTLCPQPPEQLVRWAVQKVLSVADPYLIERCLVPACGAHGASLPLSFWGPVRERSSTGKTRPTQQALSSAPVRSRT